MHIYWHIHLFYLLSIYLILILSVSVLHIFSSFMCTPEIKDVLTSAYHSHYLITINSLADIFSLTQILVKDMLTI